MNAWDNLPNAAHIDAVLDFLKSHTWELQARDTAWYVEARNAARPAAAQEAVSRCISSAWEVLDAVSLHSVELWSTAAARAALDAILSLIAWDHSAKYLTMSSDRLMIWGELSGDPACVLLLPYVRVRELIGGNDR